MNDPAVAPLIDQVDRVFRPGGPLEAALEGFEARDGQRRLAREIAQTFDAGGTLLAEAGTGTGKTLAYLVPAVLSGRRVLISTGTRTLQDQIVHKDVPALARAIGRPIRATCMKGRTNYLCRHRFDRLSEASAGLTPAERHAFDTVQTWVAVTDTGDRAELEDLPEDLPLWTDLSATSEQCLGRECPRHADCFITRMRDRAAGSELVIVNHHLLCADAAVRDHDFGEVIPPCDLAVIDEAHQLEDVVTVYFGVSVGTRRIEEFCRDAIASVPGDDPPLAFTVRDAVADVQAAARRWFESAAAFLAGDPGGGDRGRRSAAFSDARMPTERRAPVTASAGSAFDEHGRALVRTLGQFADAVETRAELPPELGALRVRAAALRADVDRVLAADTARDVRFVEERGRNLSVRAAPIDVSAIVQDSILAGRIATVLTSATLTVETSFDYVRSRLGAEDARLLRLPSEFDFASQAMLFLPDGMPDPRDPEFNRAAAWIVADLLDRTRGRAFVLFTSYAAMHEVRRLVEPRVSWPLLVQGSAPRSVLLRDFRATPTAVLFATSSFWQGVDVAGDALSAVIIDRLPFASPADPLMAARLHAIRARGGDPFHDYQVPLATLTLLQGLGRLIRTRTDRGLLAILDPRLTRMAYGRRFLASLPPARLTTDPDAISRFLA